MKKLLLFLWLLFFSFPLFSQADITRISTDIKKLSGEYLSSFKNLKGALKYESNVEAIYYSRLKLCGSIDSSNYIRLDKDRQFWTYHAIFDKEKVNYSTLDSLFLEMNFPFGKLKLAANDPSFGNGYTPDNKKGVADKIRSFFLQLYDRTGQTPGKIFFSLGENDYYWFK